MTNRLSINFIVVAVLVTSLVACQPGPLLTSTRTETTLPAISSKQANFTGTPGHATSGSVSLNVTANGDRQLVFSNFSTVNGPDLNVYLKKDKSASQFLDLGDLIALSGSFLYNIPADTDLDDFNSVLIWCVAAGVLFGCASLQ